VSENSKRTLQNGRIGPLRDCPQAPEHGTTIMLSCPGRLAPGRGRSANSGADLLEVGAQRPTSGAAPR